MTKHQERQLDHFLALARKGAHGGCSGGEGRAAALADAIIANVWGIDSDAAFGAVTFLQLAHRQRNDAQELLRGGGK